MMVSLSFEWTNKYKCFCRHARRAPETGKQPGSAFRSGRRFALCNSTRETVSIGDGRI